MDMSGTHERVFSINAQAGVNIVLDITVVLRELPTTLDPQIGAIHAGNDIDVQVFDSLQGTRHGRGRRTSPSTCSRRRRPARWPAAACTSRTSGPTARRRATSPTSSAPSARSTRRSRARTRSPT